MVEWWKNGMVEWWKNGMVEGRPEVKEADSHRDDDLFAVECLQAFLNLLDLRLQRLGLIREDLLFIQSGCGFRAGANRSRQIRGKKLISESTAHAAHAASSSEAAAIPTTATLAAA